MDQDTIDVGQAEAEEFIEHFGTKGMRWGVRKNKSSGGSASGDSKGKSDGDSKGKSDGDSKGSSSKGKSSSEMSTTEMREVVARMQVEKQYKELTAKPEKKNAGKEVAIGILKNVATQQFTRVINQEIGNMIDSNLANRKSYRKKSPKAHTLSDKELKDTVKRMDLETKYNKSRK